MMQKSTAAVYRREDSRFPIRAGCRMREQAALGAAAATCGFFVADLIAQSTTTAQFVGLALMAPFLWMIWVAEKEAKDP
ncbi:MAG: hypothetical protein LC772_02405 [Chloroflexi bacterium]|nr:hypothetical protein [Chloroflexota bacterium]